jgi:hypothetical protein
MKKLAQWGFCEKALKPVKASTHINVVENRRYCSYSCNAISWPVYPPPSFAQLCKTAKRLVDRAHRPSSSTETAKDSSTELIDRCMPASNQKTARTKTERTRRKNRKRDRASTHLARCSARANALTIRIKKI